MNAVAEMLFSDPAPAVCWLTLMVLALPAVLLLASPDAMRHPSTLLRELADVLRRPAKIQPETDNFLRYAEEVRVAADRASYSADRWEELWESAVERTEQAWHAAQDAQARLVQTRAASAFGTPSTPHSPAEYADRERFLHRTVRAAADRGELPVSAVADALAGHGWDARLHPADQELAVHRVSAAYLREQHRLAAAAEKTAWHDVHLARRTRDDLGREAVAAAVSATTATELAPVREPRRATRPAMAATA